MSCWTRIYPAFANSVDPDQMAEEASWSGSALSEFISTIWIKETDWLTNRNRYGVLFYSAWRVNYHYLLPASVAQLDAPSDWRPGGRGFNPRRGQQHSFVEIDHKIFSTVILSLPLIQEGQLSVSGERMCTILVNRLEDQACPVNVWLGKLTALDMTPLGWLGRKINTNKPFSVIQIKIFILVILSLIYTLMTSWAWSKYKHKIKWQ